MLFKRFNAVEIVLSRTRHCCGYFVVLIPIEDVYKRSTQTSITLVKRAVLNKVLESAKVTSLTTVLGCFT